MTAWLASRSPRERMLLALAAGLAAATALVGLALGVRDDLEALRDRVAGHERELSEVRRLAARLRQAAEAERSDGAALVTRLEAAAGRTVGRERIAALTPDGSKRVTLEVSDAPLAELIRLLHDLEAGTPPLPVTRLELRKQADQPARFGATLEVVR
jgi:type II secretory pathway component PulM